MDIICQRATPQDLAQLEPLVEAYHAFEGFPPQPVGELSQAILTLLQNDALGSVWLVFVADTPGPIGYIAICFGYSIEFGGRDAFVDEFYLQEAYRGQGIGTKTLQRACEEAKKQDVQALHLEVGRHNDAAQALYTRAGFKPREKFVIMSRDLT